MLRNDPFNSKFFLAIDRAPRGLCPVALAGGNGEERRREGGGAGGARVRPGERHGVKQSIQGALPAIFSFGHEKYKT
jgi:hypothetical protein